MRIVVPNTEENLRMCMCPNCPTFKSSPLSTSLFCAKGKAEETVLHAGCMCTHCPVSSTYGLSLEYFCVRGKSADIPPKE
jgi:hypothetical protein